ncbi:MAG: hypothetical protein HKN76_16775 [Saprospiraceae bacterium]|nr:hypothetical protein [Saprospiraceae bacterium]
MNSKYFFPSILVLFTISSCYQENPFFTEEPATPRYPNVAEALWDHFEEFESEAAERGIAINLARENLTAVFKDIAEDHVAGQCSYSYARPRTITIDSPFWNRSTYLGREMIVFHELGHCVLNRDHDEGTFPSGLCRSIMRSGTCCCRDAYTSQNRAYYLDELFEILQPLESAR